MDRNVLDGWLALAAETRRVDRLSSTLGLDSPAFQNSPSSLGSSRGSSGLNTPSQNAFRFLPFLNDISPELLKSTSFDFGRPALPLSRERSPQSQPFRNSNLPQTHARRQVARQRASSDAVNASQSDWKPPKLSRAHPYPYHNPTGHLVGGTPSSNQAHHQRPSLHSNRHMSYPAWPESQPVAPLSADLNMDTPYSPSIYAATHSGEPRVIAPRYGHNRSSEFEYAPAINDSVSPLLSEPFHRLIVKDEDEPVELPGVPSSSQTIFDGEMNAVPEEDDEPSTWWNDDTRDMPFEFEIPSDYQRSSILPGHLEKPWIPPRRGFS